MVVEIFFRNTRCREVSWGRTRAGCLGRRSVGATTLERTPAEGCYRFFKNVQLRLYIKKKADSVLLLLLTSYVVQYNAFRRARGDYYGPVRLSELWRNLDGLEEC